MANDEMTPEEYQSYLNSKGLVQPETPDSLPGHLYQQAAAQAEQRRNKYGNRRVQVDDYTFDSQAEADYYVILKARQASGEIFGLKVHPRYVIVDGFQTQAGRTVRPTYYEADFEYYEKLTGRWTVVDVKGVATSLFKLKAKLFQFRYGGRYDFEVVPAADVRGRK